GEFGGSGEDGGLRAQLLGHSSERLQSRIERLARPEVLLGDLAGTQQRKLEALGRLTSPATYRARSGHGEMRLLNLHEQVLLEVPCGRNGESGATHGDHRGRNLITGLSAKQGGKVRFRLVFVWRRRLRGHMRAQARSCGDAIPADSRRTDGRGRTEPPPRSRGHSNQPHSAWQPNPAMSSASIAQDAKARVTVVTSPVEQVEAPQLSAQSLTSTSVPRNAPSATNESKQSNMHSISPP